MLALFQFLIQTDWALHLFNFLLLSSCIVLSIRFATPPGPPCCCHQTEHDGRNAVENTGRTSLFRHVVIFTLTVSSVWIKNLCRRIFTWESNFTQFHLFAPDCYKWTHFNFKNSSLHHTPFFFFFWSFNSHHKTPQKSSMTGVPFLSLQGALELNPQVDPLHNEPLVQMWLEIKIKPLLKSITKGFLSCLSTKRFSCSTYQTVYVPVKPVVLSSSPSHVWLFSANSSSSRVRELSRHFSGMNPVRQKWIYSFFMYPFLSGPDVAGKAGTSSFWWFSFPSTTHIRIHHLQSK